MRPPFRGPHLVVDNGSDDGTTDVARPPARKSSPNVAAASYCGRDGAGRDRYRLVLMVDGDGSYPAEGGQLLVEQYLREPVDMITGIRSAQKAAQAFRPMHHGACQFSPRS